MLATLVLLVGANSAQQPGTGEGGGGVAKMPDFSHAGLGSADAVNALLERVLLAGGDPPQPAAAGHAPTAAGPRPLHPFELKIVEQCADPPRAGQRSRLCFELGPGSAVGRVALSGTSGVELARGAAHYLRTRCNMSFAWQRTGGNQVAAPPPGVAWPAVHGTETRYRTVEYSYFQNVVESSYSFAFYSWADWEKLIDWQALTGINLGLAYTGQEEIYRKTFAAFGVNSSVFGNWTNGPAWLSWSRGQSMHGVGAGGAGSPGPTTALTEAWMTAQHALQQRILARMRELGIVPILPAFQGNVPPVMAELHPGANISVQGGGRHYAAWLDGTDPLFGKIADKYMQTMCADFGCDEHWYEADGYFAAGRPPWYDEEAAAVPQQAPSPPSPHRHHAQEAARALEASSGKAKKHCCCAEKQCSLPAKPACCSCCPSAPLNPAAVANAKTHALAAYTAMNRTDPQAIWYYQGWILGGQYSYIKGLTEAVRPGQLVISDMWCEGGGGIWKADNDFSFFNAPFIWGVLHNFGGNVGMWGDVSSLNSGPFDAFANASSIAGLGMFPEGIDQNSPYYSFLFDVAFETEPFNLRQWWESYALQRYGRHSATATRAWELLAETVYGREQEKKSMYGEKARDGITSYMFSGNEEEVQPLWNNNTKVYDAWDLLVETATQRHFAPVADGRRLAAPGQGAATAGGRRSGGDGDTSGDIPETLRYDIVNTGREYLAKLSNSYFTALANATTPKAVAQAGAALETLSADVDALLCTDPVGFSAKWWIDSAIALGSTKAEQRSLEWAARAQPTTWLPACDADRWPTPSGNVTDQVTGTCGARSDLADYSNKQWGGLLSGFYLPRQQCYWQLVAKRGMPVKSTDIDYNKCLDGVAWRFQHDFGAVELPLCPESGDTVLVAKRLLAKYKPRM